MAATDGVAAALQVHWRQEAVDGGGAIRPIGGWRRSTVESTSSCKPCLLGFWQGPATEKPRMSTGFGMKKPEHFFWDFCLTSKTTQMEFDHDKKDLPSSFSDFLLLRHRSRIGVPVNPALDLSCFSMYLRYVSGKSLESFTKNTKVGGLIAAYKEMKIKYGKSFVRQLDEVL
ncbi:integrase [Striga asiatica]|uniref:Integrase n=1 Tax=Striga asiatica TaxID=4170 RepID=A0A5A7QLN4_STRAF|nr:integrase [Striga asiatica]